MNYVTVNLTRVYNYQVDDESPEIEYGPGIVQVPLPMAENLKRRNVIQGWEEYSGHTPRFTPEPESLVPSDELAPDFPHREYLFMAGHTTYGHVGKLSFEELIDLPGIGKVRAMEITTAMEAAIEKMPKRDEPQRIVSVRRAGAEPVTTVGDVAEIRTAVRRGKKAKAASEEAGADSAGASEGA